MLSGTGARANKDGCEALASAFNASNIPVEAQEASHPVIVERFELIKDSAGPGRFRGGCGVRRDLKVLATDGKLTNLTDRQRLAPYGLDGGLPGATGRTVIAAWLRADSTGVSVTGTFCERSPPGIATVAVRYPTALTLSDVVLASVLSEYAPA